MKSARSRLLGFLCSLLALSSAPVFATDHYEYGSTEYPAIANGISPEASLPITAHGEGELGYGSFHLYLFDALKGKKIGPLEEIADVLDTGAGSYAAKWSKDSAKATIVYRVDRHAPLKAMTYRFTKGRAIPATKAPVDVTSPELNQFWSDCCSKSKPPLKTFGTPK